MIKNIIQWLLVGTVALAGNPDPSNKFKFGDGATSNKILEFNRGSSNPQIRWNEAGQQLEFTNDGTNFSGIGSGSGSGGGGINILQNSDFESGITLGWTNTGGAFLSVSAGSNLLFGKKSATFQSFGSNNRVDSTLYTVPNGLASGNCAAGIWYLGGDSNLVLQALDGSSNILASRTLTPTTVATPFFTTFVCPASGSQFRLRVTSTGASALVALDTMFLGQNSLINVAQAQVIGSAFIPTTGSCAWSTTSSTPAAFTATPACPGPTVESNPGPGTIQTTDTDLPQFTVNNLPPGIYEVLISGSGGNTGGNGNNSFTISDGTSLSGNTGGDNVSNSTTGFSVHGYFTYTNAGNRTFALFGATTSNTLTVNADNGAKQLYFSIKKFPLAQEQAIRPDASANSWSGYHDNTCLFNVSQTTFAADFPADTSCNLVERSNTNFGTVVLADDGTPGNYLPGIKFTPSSPGKYFICADFAINGNSLNQAMDVGLFDVNNTLFGSAFTGVTTTSETEHIHLCGIMKVTSTSPQVAKIRGAVTSGSMGTTSSTTNVGSIEWQVIKIDQPLPAPILVNSVVSNSNGVEVICRGIVTNTGSVAGIFSSSGGCLASATRSATGVVQINFAANTFSDVPSCVCSSHNQDHCCSVGNSGSGTVPAITSSGFESHVTGCSSGTTSDEMVYVLCQGPK